MRRTPQANLRLGLALTFVAGAVNAGGFLAVGRYTSHMTGVVSTIADSLVLGQWTIAAGALVSLATFLAGAASTTVLIHWARRRRLRSQFAIPLLLEAALLLAFGLAFGRVGAAAPAVAVWPTVLLLCFLMGLQNAVITKISRAEIRTTHVTGLVTDVGIGLGRLLYRNRTAGLPPVRADRQRLRVHALLVAGFSVGGLAGALGFKHVGSASTLPLAAMLATISLRPLLDDVRIRRRLAQRG